MKNLIIFISLVVLISACKTRPLPECISKKTKDVSVRWGEQFRKSKSSSGFLIEGSGAIYKFSFDSSNIEKKEAIGFVDGKWFCSMTEKIQDAILKTQVSNEPGDTTQFIEFSNPSTKFYYRGQWVRKFKTKNSVLFREVYDSLQVYKPELKK